MFQGISIHQFNKFFQNEDDSKQYLFDLKWKDGYQCVESAVVKKVIKGELGFIYAARAVAMMNLLQHIQCFTS